MSKKNKTLKPAKKAKRKPPHAKRSALPERFAPPVRTASPAQLKWVRDLLNKKQLDKWPAWAAMTKDLPPKKLAAFHADFRDRMIDTMSFADISKLIDTLKALPEIGRMTNGGHTNGGLRIEYEVMEDDNGRALKRGRIYTKEGGRVLGGSYGLKTKGEQFTNDTTFFKVWVGDRGGWNVQMYVSDDLNRVEMNYATKIWVLGKIAKNPEKAARRFGKKFGKCSICSRGLTNDLSRKLGIGPVCRTRL